MDAIAKQIFDDIKSQYIAKSNAVVCTPNDYKDMAGMLVKLFIEDHENEIRKITGSEFSSALYGIPKQKIEKLEHILYFILMKTEYKFSAIDLFELCLKLIFEPNIQKANNLKKQ